MMKSCFIIIILVLSLSVHSNTYFTERSDISPEERTNTFLAIYGAQWAFYLTSQYHIIKEDGSVENWVKHTTSPRFDYDSFDFNIVKHTLSGSFYYLAYRSRGYYRREAFLWSTVSSLAFEFTIETITERPSYQDIYQTPIYGTILGIGLESASDYFHSKQNWLRYFGYLFNPFTLFHSPAREEVSFAPIINKDQYGLVMRMEFE